jgi:hypothetical protein
MEMAAFWIVMSYGGLRDDAGSKHPRNTGKLLPDYTAQQTRREWSSRFSVRNHVYIIIT